MCANVWYIVHYGWLILCFNLFTYMYIDTLLFNEIIFLYKVTFLKFLFMYYK